MTNVVALRKNETAAQVIDDAAGNDLEHVMVVGVRRDGSNYFQTSGQSTLKDLAWLEFCASNALHRMIGTGILGS